MTSFVLTRIRIVTKHVANEKVAFDTIEKDDSSMVEGATAVDRARAGVAGRRNVTYKLTYNGELVATKVLAEVLSQPPSRDRPCRHAAPGLQLRRRQHRVGRARQVRVRR